MLNKMANQNFNEIPEQRTTEEKILKKKIFTCSEIEEENSNNNSGDNISTTKKNIMHEDPAVLFSSSKKLTRYDIADLRKMQESHFSRQKPPCLYSENIIRLNILKSEEGGKLGNHDKQLSIGDRVKMLEENIHTLSFQNWNSTIHQNYTSYHRALLNPNSNNNSNASTNSMGNNPFNHRQQQQQSTTTAFNTSLPPPPLSQNFQGEGNDNSQRRVSFDIDQQQKALDKILTYDRKKVFFDTLTTTAIMCPPPKYGTNNPHFPPSQNQQQQQQLHHQHYSRRNNNYLNQKHSRVPFDSNNNNNFPRKNAHANLSFSPGYFSSSANTMQNESINNSRIRNEQANNSNAATATNEKKLNEYPFKKNKTVATAAAADDEEKSESEPEWFNFPVDRDSIVDLQGFDDSEEAYFRQKAAESKERAEKEPKVKSAKEMRAMIDRMRQQQLSQENDNLYLYEMPNVHAPFFNNNNRGSNNNNRHNNHSGNHDYLMNNINQNYLPNLNNQRFRNPLHQAKITPSPKTPTLPPAATNFNTNKFVSTSAFTQQKQQGGSFQPMNPFYEAWKSGGGKAMNQKHVNFTHLLQHAQFTRQMPTSMRLMSDIEQGMIQNSQTERRMQSNLPTGNIQQFFQNFSNSPVNNTLNNNAIISSVVVDQQQQRSAATMNMNTFPTHEQLQQHTSEILRNAILRNREQQYHDESNNQ